MFLIIYFASAHSENITISHSLANVASISHSLANVESFIISQSLNEAEPSDPLRR